MNQIQKAKMILRSLLLCGILSTTTTQACSAIPQESVCTSILPSNYTTFAVGNQDQQVYSWIWAFLPNTYAKCKKQLAFRDCTLAYPRCDGDGTANDWCQQTCSTYNDTCRLVIPALEKYRPVVHLRPGNCSAVSSIDTCQPWPASLTAPPALCVSPLV